MSETNETMKASVARAHLELALKVVKHAINKKALLPVLQSVRVEQLPAGLAIDATDMEIAIRALIPESCGPQKPVLIPAEKLSAWTQLLDSEEVRITIESSHCRLQCGKARAAMPIYNAVAWPDNITFSIEDEGATLPQDVLARALRFAMITISQDESKYTLRAIKVESCNGKLLFIATDGHRMLVYTTQSDEQLDLLLPADFVSALLPLLDGGNDALDITHNAKEIIASIPGDMPVFLKTKKLSGQFPNWKAVLPSGHRTEIKVNAETLLVAVERSVLLSPAESHTVALNFGEQIEIEAADPQHGQSNEWVECEGSVKPSQRVGINADYLIKFLRKLKGEIVISLSNTPSSNLLFKATPEDTESIEYVVCPVRLEK